MCKLPLLVEVDTCAVFVRFSSKELFKDETLRNFFADNGRQMIADLLIHADRVSSPYEWICIFMHCCEVGFNWKVGKTFYGVVIES